MKNLFLWVGSVNTLVGLLLLQFFYSKLKAKGRLGFIHFILEMSHITLFTRRRDIYQTFIKITKHFKPNTHKYKT